MDGWPELVAFCCTFLNNVASSDDQSNVLLCDHTPKVLESVIEGSLGCDYLAIANWSHRPVDKVCINVTIYKRVACLHACAWHKDRPRVLVRFYI